MKRAFLFLFLPLYLLAISGCRDTEAAAKSATTSFTADTTLGQASLTVNFSDTSTTSGGPITAWLWDFGDGSPSSSSQHPSHTYTAAGSYTVSLTVTEGGQPYATSIQRFVNVTDGSNPPAGQIDLSSAVVVTRPGALPNSEAKASVVLVEEIQKRTGLNLSVTSSWPATGTVIALTSQPGLGIGAEGYRLFSEAGGAGPTVVWVVGEDPRGVLYGVGKLLRSVEWGTGLLRLAQAPDITTAPDYPLRGHQLGYRNTANTYDGWSVAQYEQYIRELVIFGANAIENIPFDSPSPHFQITAAQMNQAVSAICDDYGIEYWVWTPASFDLNNTTLRNQALADHVALYQDCARLDGVFVPGGDPGSNPPLLVLDFVEDLHTILVAEHLSAGVWLSNQGFEHAENDVLFDYLQTQQPTWLKGMVYGPWTWMTLDEMRTRTPGQYPIRHYPDITHNVRCQYPVPEWDQAFAHTQNREASNPRPTEQSLIHNRYASLTCGFLAYSDGAHDDVNKQVWSMRGWDPNVSVDEIVEDYVRFFFGHNVVDDVSSGILDLEANWQGPLLANTGVDTTFDQWTALETQNPGLADDWRWQYLLLRAYSDRYIRARLINETNLQQQARATLANAPSLGANNAINSAEATFTLATTNPVRMDLRNRIEDLCIDLFASIKYQSSVSAPYLASGLERSCILDLIDWPVNDRYHYEYVFTNVIAPLATQNEKLVAIETLLKWEDPGPAGYYDDLGNAAKQAHLVQQLPYAQDPGFVESTQNEFSWHGGSTTDPKRGAALRSWQDHGQTLYGQPVELHYTNLAADAVYTVRATYLGRFNSVMTLNADGNALGTSGTPATFPYQVTYPIPQSTTADGVLHLEWDRVSGRGCQIAEVWLTTPDADEDGMPDYWEQRFGLDINDATGDNGALGDPDGDNAVNIIEFQSDTDPSDPDSLPATLPSMSGKLLALCWTLIAAVMIVRLRSEKHAR